MGICGICPRDCASRPGFCLAGEAPLVARADLHMWEEPPITGKGGAGAVFFSGCNLRCVFCQNWDISTALIGEPCPPERLCELFFALEEKGASNIDLVTPTPHAKAVKRAMELSRARGLKLPFVWNSNAYENVSMLKELEGLVDVYLPDMKYADCERAARYSAARDYPSTAMAAIAEMRRQTGPFVLNDEGVAMAGTMVRHLLLPGGVADARRVIDFVADELPKGTAFSLMRQYTPMFTVLKRPNDYPFLTRRVTDREYKRAVDYAESKGLFDVYVQMKESADIKYTPAFDGTGVNT